MKAVRFKITYLDPETDRYVTEVKEFSDSHEPHFISAKDWAHDWAYMKADKGPCSLEELKDG